MTNLNLYSFTFTFLGIIFGIIYVLDAWKSNAKSDDLAKSPKIKGILYAIGGTVISAISEAVELLGNSSRPGDAIQDYLLGFTFTTIILILTLGIVSFFLAKNQIKNCKNPSKRKAIFGNSALLAAIAVLDGFREFMIAIEKLREENKIIRRIENQKDNAIELLSGYYSSLVININNDKLGPESFKEYSRKFIDEFRKKILLPNDSFRIGIYYFNKSQNQFTYFVGLSPSTAPHTRNPIPSEGSLAGYAYQHPYTPHMHIIDDSSNQENQLFYARQKKHWYKSVIVCSIKPMLEQEKLHSNLPFLILSIDSIDNLKESENIEFIKAMIFSQAVAFGNALVAMKLTEEDFIS